MITIDHDPESGCLGGEFGDACPFYADEMGPACGAVGGKGVGEDAYDFTPAPDWCPLRRGPVLVRAKVST